MANSPAVLDLDLLSPQRYATEGYPHEAWTRLRREAPVCRIEQPGFEPYWAVTRHAHILEVSHQPALFLNSPAINVKATDIPTKGIKPPRTIVHMDLPDHRPYRRVAVARFTPRAVAAMEARIREIARTVLLAELGAGGEHGVVDFAATVASWHPLKVIAEIIGIPAEDHAAILHWTNLILGGADAEYQQGGDQNASVAIGNKAMAAYMVRLAAARRAAPSGDLGSALVQARIDGAPMPDYELISYFMAVALAGHDTTRNALAGGVLALLDHPEELARLRADPTLLDSAIDEILRWTSVVIHFARTTSAAVTLGGVQLGAGERLALFYPSGNRDEAVFADPFAFRIDRRPNPHLAFGHGEHFCLGSNLARMELRALLGELLARTTHLELAGEVEWLAANFVGGVKHLPLAYRLA